MLCVSDPKPGYGSVKTNLESGALILKDAHGKAFRISVNEPKVGEPGERAGSLPAGSYLLVGYRLYRKDSEGTPWILSVSAPSLRKVAIADGQTAELKVDPVVSITSKLAANGQVQMMVAGPGDGRSGATLYKNGKRIPMGFRVLGQDGKALREGSINYG